jgi:hypothetical protein
VGRISDESVCARWDGQSLIVSRTLWEHTMVAIAVEAAFAEGGTESRDGSADASSPESIMLALVTCCDQIDVAEYELGGHRRVISASS